MLEGLKVVTNEEMRRIESLAYTQGHREGQFMDGAGAAIAQAVARWIESRNLPKRLFLLAGKGNNGGDGYTAALHLLQMGISVRAFQLFSPETCSPLCRERYDQFTNAGGAVTNLFQGEPLKLDEPGVILDGIVGTGFQGKAEGIVFTTIASVNNKGMPILAIDIPSGLNGTTGEVGSIAIEATATLYLGLPKLGFFIQDGWDHVGELHPIDFGLPAKFVEQAESPAYLLAEAHLTLPKLRRTQHKYDAGYLLAVAGSIAMTGAAFLASLAALRSGAGIVRLFTEKGMSTASAPWEVICEERDLQRIFEEVPRATSLLIGPGLGRARATQKFVASLLERIGLPTLIDADALHALPKTLPAKTLITPHRGEMRALLGDQEPSIDQCQKFVEERSVTLTLKGAPTFVFHPGTKPLIIPRGDPGMATAGSGDVLSGIYGGLLKHDVDMRAVAALGAYLHALAGEICAREKGSHSLIASDLITAIPRAYLQIS
jgi:NAD(P)H-hydrate epimerase